MSRRRAGRRNLKGAWPLLLLPLLAWVLDRQRKHRLRKRSF